MSNTLFTNYLGDEEFNLVVDRLGAIYERLLDMRKPRTAGIALSKIPSTIRTRIEAVDDAESGLRYAVWCIGETLAATSGMDGLHFTYALFEDRYGERGASWLDHRWDGISVGTVRWVA